MIPSPCLGPTTSQGTSLTTVHFLYRLPCTREQPEYSARLPCRSPFRSIASNSRRSVSPFHACHANRSVLRAHQRLLVSDRCPCRHRAPAPVAAAHHNEFPLRCAAPPRGGRHCASPRPSPGTLCRAQSGAYS